MNKVPASATVDWYKKGWQTFASDMVTWLILSVLFLVIMIVLMLIPVIGSLAYYLVAPALMGGLLLAAKESLEGGKAEIQHLIAPLQDENLRTPLLTLGAILLGANLILGILGVGTVGSFSAATSGHAGLFGGLGLFSGLLMLIVSMVIGAAFFYAPAQVIFANTAPVDAIKNSLTATIQNVPALLLFGLIYMVLSVLAAIPLGLGFLVLIPVMTGALYASYRDVF